jgi:hypothetical protein
VATPVRGAVSQAQPGRPSSWHETSFADGPKLAVRSAEELAWLSGKGGNSMNLMLAMWIVSAVVMILLAGLLGQVVRKDRLGLLIDNRGRYSLTHLQVTLWTIVVLSLIFGVFVARVLSSVPNALDFTIPNELLLIMGISVGSAAAATVVKAGKDASRPASIAASNASDRPRLAQIFLLEEGEFADQVVDVTKYQGFWITVILLIAYTALAVAAIAAAGTPSAFNALPGFPEAFVTLLGVSHAGYLAGKIPDRPGTPPGLTLHLRRLGAVPGGPAVAAPPRIFSYQPRNP